MYVGSGVDFLNTAVIFQYVLNQGLQYTGCEDVVCASASAQPGEEEPHSGYSKLS